MKKQNKKLYECHSTRLDSIAHFDVPASQDGLSLCLRAEAAAHNQNDRQLSCFEMRAISRYPYTYGYVVASQSVTCCHDSLLKRRGRYYCNATYDQVHSSSTGRLLVHITKTSNEKGRLRFTGKNKFEIRCTGGNSHAVGFALSVEKVPFSTFA